ncbi:hypothetical protein K432DRAFT_187605 [Lepidopterella palustris CBS 459.81]|uniref:F-box domain-containing protein n=1 Tax=Lepidopterella palustris CBS 459.81 TaxID=1314670 RepID=A0A8E2JHZ2_9PEZI|nr:hypothetical protein K432DRAFT_187605 [Lepidopterella palustris CBS 459.81]
MAASGVVEAFKRLSTSDERAAALEAIIKELNPYEWREAFARLKRRTFQCDLVSSLPIEIGIQIFRYLDISTPFRLQSVSKNWRRLLTSPDILRPMLSTWYSDLDRPLEGEASLRGQDYAVCQLKAEHMHRFRRGAPFSWVRINLSEQEPWNMRSTMPRHPAKVDFIDETVAWLDNTPESSLVKVCNLRTKKSLIVGGEGRERIHYIKLTTELISFTTFSGRIYACDLATGERRSFRLPSARSPIFSCRGRTIGGTIWEAQTSEESTVFIWNFDTCKCQTFQIENPRPYHPPWGTAQ